MKKYYTLISLAVSLLIAYFLVRQIDIKDVSLVLSSIRPPFLLAALGVFILATVIRAHRFYFLLQKKISFLPMLNISFAHTLLTNVLPARTGELSYLYYVRKSGRVSVGDNLASLFIARVFDTLAAIFLMIVALAFLVSSVASFQQVLFLTSIALVLLGALLAVFVFWQTKLLWLANFIFRFLKLSRFSLGDKILTKLKESVIAVGTIRDKKLFAKTFVSSIFIWLLFFVMFLLVAQGFGLTISFWGAIFASGLIALSNIVPLYTVGNFGIFEASTALGLVLLGFNKELAISFSFVNHIATILISLVPGVVSYILLAKK